MKTSILKFSLLFGTTVLLVQSVPAPPYSIDWYTVGGGGAMNVTGGAYTLSGTIGQPDAGPTMSGGNYSLEGGFWGVSAALPAPKLTITRSGSNVIICWPSLFTGYVLEQNANLNPGSWIPVGITPSDNGTTRCVTIPAAPGTVFYRLKK
jgi:hypothetical protein